jgi:small subunit ribosomal protein S8e
MGITRSSKTKRRSTGGRMPIHRKKRKFEMGRQPSMTKLGAESKVISVRGRGGNIKRRALRMHEGNFTWTSEKIARKTKIVDVVYNATNNELVRTKTLVKGAIVAIDPTPFKYYWTIHYNEKKITRMPVIEDPARVEALRKKEQTLRQDHPFTQSLDKLSHFFELMNKGRLYACLTSRPGQTGRCDGYLLEGKELDFYLKKLDKK